MSLRKLLLAGIVAGVAGAADAQISRVFVSVNGNDANVCSNIATPCRTLSGGITQVDANGEVIVIDTGSYAGTTITKSVKVNVAPGVVAFSGLPIVVNPGSGTVVLRGLTLKAATVGENTAINHQSGTLFVENTVVDGWYRGLEAQVGAVELYIKGSVFRNQASEGVFVAEGTSASVAIDGSFFENNAVGAGVFFKSGLGRVSNSVMTNNSRAVMVEGAGTDVTVHRCEAFGNFIGFLVESSGVLRVSQSTAARNSLGLSNASGTLESFGNNVVRANSTSDTNGPITTVGLQ